MNTSLVVLTDFFAVSNRALSYAAGLAVPLKAALVLLHVRRDGLLAPEEYHGRQTQQGEQHTTRALQHLAAEQPVPTEVDISDEFLPDAVKIAVRHHHPLLLVLGRPGSASTPLEVVINTAMDLLRHAPYPLLVVPTVGWDAFPPQHLLLAVDGEAFRLLPHQQVIRRLLEATKGTLDIIHITDEEHTRPELAEVLDTMRDNELVDELTESQVHDLTQHTVAGGILQEASRLEADMVVVVARRHSLLGGLFHRSVTAQLLQESPIPVLVLPAEE
jgi:nucleotide-binding universal stress UspA family protein